MTPDLTLGCDMSSEKAIGLSEPQCCQSVKLDNDVHTDSLRAVVRGR